MSKESKTTKKKVSLKLQSIYPSSECLHHHLIHRYGQSAVETRFHGVNGSVHIAEEENRRSGAKRKT